MKSSAIYFSILSITLSLFIGFSCTSGHDHEKESSSGNHKLEGESIPLIYHMSFLNRYARKLYFSGLAENWDLADIYTHEMEEIAAFIAEARYFDDGINISELMEAMLLPQIEQIEVAIENQDPELFERNYRTLIQTCNQCHTEANYGAVRVTIPGKNPFNQDFNSVE